MMHRYELWFVVQRDGVDVAARFDTKVEFERPTEENILALLLDMEYVTRSYKKEGNTEIPISCEKEINGNWRIDDGGMAVIELRLKV
jgi:hypothetical protein